jgi:MFS family permease
VGGLVTATRGRTGIRALVGAATVFGVSIAFAAVTPVLAVELVALALVGYGSVSFLSMANSTLQLETEPQMRGRVMALWSVAFMGTTPIGGPVIGWITGLAGARVGLGVGAVSCLVAGAIGLAAMRWLGGRRRPSDSGPAVSSGERGQRPALSSPSAG